MRASISSSFDAGAGLRTMGSVDISNRALRHAVVFGVVGRLHDGDAAALLDRPQPRRAVVEDAGQDDADGALAVQVRGRAKERVDGRTVAIVFGTARDAHSVIVDEEVMVRRRDVDVRGADEVAVLGSNDRQPRIASQDLDEVAAPVGLEVHDDEERRREVLGQRRYQSIESGDAACRSDDDDDVALRHAPIIGPLYTLARRPLLRAAVARHAIGVGVKADVRAVRRIVVGPE
jgi:hypothetical protein